MLVFGEFEAGHPLLEGGFLGEWGDLDQVGGEGEGFGLLFLWFFVLFLWFWWLLDSGFGLFFLLLGGLCLSLGFGQILLFLCLSLLLIILLLPFQQPSLNQRLKLILINRHTHLLLGHLINQTLLHWLHIKTDPPSKKLLPLILDKFLSNRHILTHEIPFACESVVFLDEDGVEETVAEF